MGWWTYILTIVQEWISLAIAYGPDVATQAITSGQGG
jgi:hypothetical protein